MKSANYGTKFGFAWIVLRPLLNAAVYGLIFGLLMGGSRPENYVSFIIVGVFCYEFFSMSLNAGARSIVGNGALIKTLAFPRLVLPISAWIQQCINFTFVVAVMLVLVFISGNPISWSFLFLPLILLGFALFCFGVGTFTARLSVHFSDFLSFLPFILRLGLYGSGVLFSLENLFGSHPTLLAIFRLNPVYSYLALSRGAVLPGYGIEIYDAIVAASWTGAVLIAGLVYFWAGERHYGRSK